MKIGEPPADLVFDPTLAVWKVAQRMRRPHALLSRSSGDRPAPRTDLLLSCTMLPAALGGLRGPFRLQLASACNHRPEEFNRAYHRTESRNCQAFFAIFRPKSTEWAQNAQWGGLIFPAFPVNGTFFRILYTITICHYGYIIMIKGLSDHPLPPVSKPMRSTSPELTSNSIKRFRSMSSRYRKACRSQTRTPSLGARMASKKPASAAWRSVRP